MTEKELQKIWHFTRHISRQSEKRVEDTFDLKFKVYKYKHSHKCTLTNIIFILLKIYKTQS